MTSVVTNTDGAREANGRRPCGPCHLHELPAQEARPRPPPRPSDPGCLARPRPRGGVPTQGQTQASVVPRSAANGRRLVVNRSRWAVKRTLHEMRRGGGGDQARGPEWHPFGWAHSVTAADGMRLRGGGGPRPTAGPQSPATLGLRFAAAGAAPARQPHDIPALDQPHRLRCTADEGLLGCAPPHRPKHASRCAPGPCPRGITERRGIQKLLFATEDSLSLRWQTLASSPTPITVWDA